MRNLLLAVATVALVLALYSPAWAQQDQYVSGDGPYVDPEPWVEGQDLPHLSPPGEGDQPADGEGWGNALFETLTGDPGDAAALKGAIEAARADRAGGVTPVAVTPVADSEPAGGEDKAEAEDSEGVAIRRLPDTSGARPLVLLGAGPVLLLVGAGLLLRRTLQ